MEGITAPPELVLLIRRQFSLRRWVHWCHEVGLYILSSATTLRLWVVTLVKRAARTLWSCPWSVTHFRHAVALYGGSKLLKFNVFVAVAALIKGAIHNMQVIEEDKPINSQGGRLTQALKWQISSLASLRMSPCFQLWPTAAWRNVKNNLTGHNVS